MSLVTLRPNSTPYNDFDTPFTPSTAAYPSNAAINGVLSDGSDATYAFGFVQAYAQVGLPAPALPAGARIKSAAARLRSQMPSGTPNASLSVSLLDGTVELSSVNNTVPTPLTTWTAIPAVALSALTNPQLQFFYLTPNTAGQRIHIVEAMIDVVYVQKPRATITGPTGTLEDTNVPTITWTTQLDSDGGAQTSYAVRVFRAEVITQPGFNPSQENGLVVASGRLNGSATSWTVPNALPDNDYAAFVAVSQTVNGTAHGSDWSPSGQFRIEVDLPAVPVIIAIPENANGAIRLETYDQPGDTWTDWLEIERSEDGGETWTTARTAYGFGRQTAGLSYAWDFEAPNSHNMLYRARAVHDYNGVYAVSTWATTPPVMWRSNKRWLKHPADNRYSMIVDIWSYPDYDQEPRQGVFMPLGGSVPIVAVDTPNARVGTVAFMFETDEQRARFDELYATGAPVLLQMTPSDARPDRWLILGSKRRSYMVDKLAVGATIDTMTWTEVNRP